MPLDSQCNIMLTLTYQTTFIRFWHFTGTLISRTEILKTTRASRLSCLFISSVASLSGSPTSSCHLFKCIVAWDENREWWLGVSSRYPNLLSSMFHWQTHWPLISFVPYSNVLVWWRYLFFMQQMNIRLPWKLMTIYHHYCIFTYKNSFKWIKLQLNWCWRWLWHSGPEVVMVCRYRELEYFYIVWGLINTKIFTSLCFAFTCNGDATIMRIKNNVCSIIQSISINSLIIILNETDAASLGDAYIVTKSLSFNFMNGL